MQKLANPAVKMRRGVALLMATLVLWISISTQAQAVTAGGNIARGIDVSKHNGSINWSQVASSGIQFAFIKAGSTNSGVDPYFDANMKGASAAGLKTGVYLYSYATTPEAAKQEAELVLQWIDGYTVNYPVVFDIEDKCHKSLSNQQLIDIINAFCLTIDAAGYYPVVYSYKNMFLSKLSICGFDKWVAQYGDQCTYSNNVCFWQYSSHGSVNGVSGRVDVNYQYKDYSSLIVQEGFVAHNDQTRFYRNWRMQTGWIDYNNTKYYLDGAGNLVRGWYTEGDKIYYLTSADGSIARGQVTVDGAGYYFSEAGVKTTGWITVGDQKFYYDPANNGILKTEWYSDAKGNFYFFDRTDGHMLTGEQVIDGTGYLFDANGIRQGGLYTGADGQTRYYDPATGVLIVNQTLELNGQTFAAGADGTLTEVVVEEAQPVAEVN